MGFIYAQDNVDQFQQKIWIFFKDKGPQDNPHLYKDSSLVSERSLKRRSKVLSGPALTDYNDLPVYLPYIEEIKPLINRLRTKSRLFNAISVEIDAEMIGQIELLDFVQSIDKVHLSRQRFPKPQPLGIKKLSVHQYELDYGPSATQLNQINVPALHAKGIYGNGVLIGILDSGFNLLYSHTAFDSLDIVAAWDFADNDDDVTGHSHGTNTLSVLAGYAPGNLIGPAFKASFLIARTEVAGSETPAEEDYWIAGIEWADSMGADIVSSSLGYYEFDDPENDYRYRDLDGKSARTTIAAEHAAENGILIFNSAGNEYGDPWNYIITPADGERVMAVGGVTSTGMHASFSSVGPTADGRIKPDIAAMGVNVVAASAYDPNNFYTVDGTSFSCPLAAGVGALLLSAFPEAAPEEIRQALKQTASQANNPDTSLGWGIINAAAAYNLLAGVKSGSVSMGLKPNYPNPFNDQTTLVFSFDSEVRAGVDIFNILGQKVHQVDTGFWSANIEGEFHNFRFRMPSTLASGLYFYRIRAQSLINGSVKYLTGKMMLIR